MPSKADDLRRLLSSGPCTARQLVEKLGISQPTLSRALALLGSEVVRVGAARSIQYVLRDNARGLPDIPVYRVDARGDIHPPGTLVAVRPEGFVMRGGDGATALTNGLPWWLFDMRPQGYLGRAYAARHAGLLGLPQRLGDWTDTHAVRALLAHGHDLVGNLLLGEMARARFLAAPPPSAIAAGQRRQAYARLAREAASGDTPPGSSAGGEQPKFTTYAETEAGHGQSAPCHVIVKFSEAPGPQAAANPVAERWRDLLLAEHLALQTLRDHGVAAARSTVIDDGEQRFLEVARFDRAGALGRRGVISLAALDAEFIGKGSGGWPAITAALAQLPLPQRPITSKDADAAALLWAFGTLIGNTDMHNGNLSFVTEQGRPYELAPAYDMTPMAFAPRSGGGLPGSLGAADIRSGISHANWRQALHMAEAWLARLRAAEGWSPAFIACINALADHMETARRKIERLA